MADLNKAEEDYVSSLDVPHILGEKSPAMSQMRRDIRSATLARQSLDPNDTTAILSRIVSLLKEAADLSMIFRNNPHDEQRRRLSLARITEAVYLGSDDAGRIAGWLRNKCIKRTGITKDIPSLLPLALKAYAPYDYSGDPERCRQSDQKVSRDYKAIVRSLSPNVLPPDLINFWNRPGCGINASSRPQPTVGGKQNSLRPQLFSVITDRDKKKRIMRQSRRNNDYVAHKKTGRRHKLCGMVDDPRIVKLATAYIQRLLAQRKPPPIQT